MGRKANRRILIKFLREVQRACLYNYIYIHVAWLHGANLWPVQNGQDGHPLHSCCVRLKYSPRIASNEKEVFTKQGEHSYLSPRQGCRHWKKEYLLTNLPPRSEISHSPKWSSLRITPIIQCPQEGHKEEHSTTQSLLGLLIIIFTRLLKCEHIYTTGFHAGKYIVISPASVIYACFVLNAKESRNQYHASHYGSTFEAVLHLQSNRPTLEFSQYLSCPWPPSGLPPRCYASA